MTILPPTSDPFICSIPHLWCCLTVPTIGVLCTVVGNKIFHVRSAFLCKQALGNNAMVNLHYLFTEGNIDMRLVCVIKNISYAH